MSSSAFVGMAVSSGNTTTLNTTSLDLVNIYSLIAIDPGITNEIMVDDGVATKDGVEAELTNGVVVVVELL